MKLLARSAIAIALGAIVLGIDVVVNIVAAGKWSWAESIGIIAVAAAIGVAVESLRRIVLRRRPVARLTVGIERDMLVDRPVEKTRIVNALKKRRRSNLIVIEGGAGYGKSTLALSVCTEKKVELKYPRIYRVRCGEDAVSGFAIASVVNSLIEEITEQRPGYTDPNMAGQRLNSVLGQLGKVLLLIDDVWTEQQIEPFLGAASKCTRLITTRNSSLLSGDATKVKVEGMSPDESRELLLRGIPSPAAEELYASDLVDSVVRQTWHWPLILRLLNKVLITRVSEDYEPRQALAEILEHISIKGPVGADELRVGLGSMAGTELVERTLKAGLPLLTGDDLQPAERLPELAIFPPRTEIPVGLVTELWASRTARSRVEAASLCSRMASLSLFTIAAGHLQIHDVMYEFLQRQLAESTRVEVANVLLDIMSQYTVALSDSDSEHSTGMAWWETSKYTDYIGGNLPYLMMQAGRSHDAEVLVCDLRWVLYRLRAASTAAVLTDLECVGTRRARDLRDAVARVAHMLGDTTVRPDAGQFLLNALRKEPIWAQQAIALQAGQSEPMLVSHWPLPDNPGPGLRHVYKIPASAKRNDAVALSPDGAWLAMASDIGISFVDTATGLVTDSYELLFTGYYQGYFHVSRLAVAPNGSRIAILSSSGAFTVFDVTAGRVIAQGYDDGALWSIAFAPNATTLVTTGNDGRIKLWDALTGERIHKEKFNAFDRSNRGSMDAIFSRDGKWVVSGGENGRVFLWSGSDGKPLRTYSGNHDENYKLAYHVAIAPDGSWVAGSVDQQIYVWNTETGKLIATLEAQNIVTALAIAPDGTRIAGGDVDGVLSVWECPGFMLETRLNGHGKVRFLGFSPDGRVLYSGGGGETRAWEPSRATTDGSSRESTPTERVMILPGGTRVAVTLQSGSVHIRDVASGQVEQTLAKKDSRFRNIAVAPDGTWLATSSAGNLSIWDANGALIKQFDVYHVTGEIIDLRISLDGSRLFTVDYIAVRSWDPGTGEMLSCMANCMEEPECVSYSPDGSWLAAGDYYGTIWVWHADSGMLHSTLGGGYLDARLKVLTGGSANTVLAPIYRGDIVTWDIKRSQIIDRQKFSSAEELAISADGQSVIARNGSTLECHDLTSRSKRMVGHIPWSTWESNVAVAFSGDSQWFAVAAGEGTVIWERTASRPHAEIGRRLNSNTFGRPHAPQAIALSFHGERLAEAWQGSVLICDTGISEVTGEFQSHEGYARALAFSPNNQDLAMIADDRISILDTSLGTKQELVGNLGAISQVAISPQERYIAIAGSEGVRVWNPARRRAVTALDWHSHVVGLVFGPGGEWLAIVGDHHITVFSLPQADLLKEFDFPHNYNEYIKGAAPSPDGGQVVIRDSSGNLIFVDLQNDEVSASVNAGIDTIDTMQVSPDGKWLATGGQNVSIRNMTDGSLITAHGMNRRVKSLAWSPDSESVAVGGDGGIYYLLFKNKPR